MAGQVIEMASLLWQKKGWQERQERGWGGRRNREWLVSIENDACRNTDGVVDGLDRFHVLAADTGQRGSSASKKHRPLAVQRVVRYDRRVPYEVPDRLGRVSRDRELDGLLLLLRHCLHILL